MIVTLVQRPVNRKLMIETNNLQFGIVVSDADCGAVGSGFESRLATESCFIMRANEFRLGARFRPKWLETSTTRVVKFFPNAR
ncbi:hypothetical protein TNCV_4566701 [Trichonephila clavipes]|nr:hypothetical protein TNCV_4566701 [Trichonephila clavipes]